MARKVSNKTKELKRTRWTYWKASQLRANWRSRCKKVKGDLDTVPTRVEIQDWLERIVPYSCYITGERLIKSKMEADHILPISRGGTFELKNIGITSKRFNSLKGAMTVKEFKQLLEVVKGWEDKGESLFKRLMLSNNIYRGRKRG